MKIQLSMGWFWFFLIQASTEISDVSKVTFKVLLRGLKNISDRSQIWELEFRVL